MVKLRNTGYPLGKTESPVWGNIITEILFCQDRYLKYIYDICNIFLFSLYIYICILVLFLSINMAQQVKILPHGGNDPVCSVHTIPWLLMVCWRKVPGHQPSCYWPIYRGIYPFGTLRRCLSTKTGDACHNPFQDGAVPIVHKHRIFPLDQQWYCHCHSRMLKGLLVLNQCIVSIFTLPWWGHNVFVHWPTYWSAIPP